MTYADVVWKLVEMLLEKQQNEKADDQNEKQQD